MNLDAIRWQRVSELFATIRALPVAERTAALTALTGNDGDLRQEVALLLDADIDDTFLDAPVQVEREPVAAMPAPRRFGAYDVLREIGRGGMGIVYAGRHTDPGLDRLVAIKTLPIGVDHPEMAWRFQRERELLARLTHPNIARLYDGGTTAEGTPYLVMEFVDGQRIDAWCDQANLSVAARLDLFQQVCAAVQHAHTQLIVHRDLKPSNVMVTLDGEVKLLDFGIARLVTPGEGAEITRGHASPMTPAYASPEQLRGDDVTTASDVFSLGVILHRLLTGTVPGSDATPTGGATPTRPPSALVTQDHATRCGSLSPTALRSTLRGDLDAIVLMALREEPARRYPSAEALRADIQRYLRGLPVQAKPDTLSYRITKFVRRQKALTAAVAVATIAVAGGLVSSTLSARRAVAEAEQARRVAGVLQELIGAGSSERYASTPTLLTVLDSARSAVTTQFASEPLARAIIYGSLGGSYFSFERPDLAALMLDSARVLYARTRGETSLEVATMLHASVWPIMALGLPDSAFTRQQHAVRLLQALQPASRRTLTQAEVELAFQELTMRNASESGLPRMATALDRERRDSAPRWDMIALGEAATIMPLQYRRDTAHAESAFVRSVAALQRQREPSQNQRTALGFQAQSLLLRGRAAEAIPILRALLAATERRFGPAHYLTAQAQNLTAKALLSLQQLPESRVLIDSAIANNEAAPTRDANYLGEMYLTRASVLMAMGDWTGAEASIARAGEQRDRLGAQRPLADVAIRFTTAALHEARGNLAAARKGFEDAVALAQATLSDGTRNRGLAEEKLAAFRQRHPAAAR